MKATEYMNLQAQRLSYGGVMWMSGGNSSLRIFIGISAIHMEGKAKEPASVKRFPTLSMGKALECQTLLFVQG